MKSLRVAIYVRVSTTHQDSQMQLDACTAVANQRGWTIVATLADDGYSGATTARPAYQQLLTDARAGRFDVVLAYKLDRLGRSTREMLHTIDSFEEWGVRFVSATQPIDTDKGSPLGRLVLEILASIGSFERELARERTRDGLAAARRRGRRGGRPRRTVDMTHALELALRGVRPDAIAKRLGISRATLYRYADDRLKNVFAAGA